MDDLISRQALCKYALNQKGKSVTPNDIMRFPSAEPKTKCIAQIRIDRDDIKDFINETVSEIIETMTEPKVGKWIFNPKDAIELMFTLPKCSECGFESADCGNFCSNCGARMFKSGGC